MSFYPIELDKTRNFKYGMKALYLAEKKLNMKISQIDMDNLSMEEAATLLWAGLQHEDKNLSISKVMDLVDDHSSLPVVMQAMGEAIALAFGADLPEPEDEEKND